MEISINGKKADITLESEKKAGEVLNGIDAWLEGTGLYISGLEVDGAVYGALSMEKAFELPLEGISRIDIKTSSWAELMMEALVGLRQDFGYFETRDAEERRECRGRWENSPPALFLKKNAPELHVMVLQTLEESFPVSAALSVIAERIREIENPRQEIGGAQLLIEETAKRLLDFPLDIQTGKDARAAETISLFSGLVEKIYRLIFLFRHFGTDIESITVPSAEGSGTVSLKEYIEEFSAALKELTAAYENNDTVFVGDLAEYELSPRLLCLGKALYGIQPERKQA
ncbi:MAG: hypothetical protein LBK74_04975 [Treponema sp.]|jgi:hypothetical protein|nr:hypothetical protein [Treponema sp.]